MFSQCYVSTSITLHHCGIVSVVIHNCLHLSSQHDLCFINRLYSGRKMYAISKEMAEILFNLRAGYLGRNKNDCLSY